MKSPLFFPLKSLKTQLDKFSNGLDKFSNGLEHLKTRLEPRPSKFSRIEDRESSVEYRALRDCQLTFEQYCTLEIRPRLHCTHDAMHFGIDTTWRMDDAKERYSFIYNCSAIKEITLLLEN